MREIADIDKSKIDENKNRTQYADKKDVREIFFKLFNNIEYLDWLIADPLLLAVLIMCARRARRLKDKSPAGLNQGEFFLSRTECNKFGLKSTQHGQIKRRLDTLVEWQVIRDTGKRIGKERGKDRSIVWAFLSNKIIVPLFEIDSIEGSETGSERTADRQSSGSKEDKGRTEEIREDIPAAAGSGQRYIKKQSSDRGYTTDPIIEFCREAQHMDKQFINYGKQLNHLKRIRQEYPDEKDIKFVIEEMAGETYWQENPFDMADVANNMYKYLNRTVWFDKPKR